MAQQTATRRLAAAGDRAQPRRRGSQALLADLRSASRRGPHWAASILLALVGTFVLCFLVWSSIAELDKVTVGMGRVIPSGQVQIVQHLEGGIVSELLVREGGTVKAGQAILQIDTTNAAASFRGDRAEYLGLLAARARLEGELRGSSPQFPSEVQKERPQLVLSELALYNGRRSELDSSIDILQRQAEQRRSELRETESKAASLSQSVRITAEEVRIQEPNVAAGITSKVELLRLQRDLSERRGQMEQAQLQVPRIRQAIAEAERRIQEKRDTFRSEALRQKNQIEVTLAAKGETMKALEDRVQRTEVRAPVTGIVKRLMVNTVGGVVKPGEPLAEIVPTDETLLIEASIRPADIAFLRPGQDARVKITAYDFAVYGSLHGNLEAISPDAILNERGDSFYKVRVRTTQNHLGKAEGSLPIIPGMVAEVNVLTGKTTVLDYLLKPLLRVQDKALRQG